MIDRLATQFDAGDDGESHFEELTAEARRNGAMIIRIYAGDDGESHFEELTADQFAPTT